MWVLRRTAAKVDTSHQGSPMKRQPVFLPVVFGLLLCGLVFHFVFGSVDAYAQMSRERQLVTRTAKSGPVESKLKPTDAVRFRAAASANASSRDTLTWPFGGKNQTGWNIYVTLISNTIDSDSDPNSPEFAASLAAWQTSRGLPSSGILDVSTLEALRGVWQSQRLGRSIVPAEDRLLTAPIVDFYDPTRAPDLLKLERETYTAYRKMIAAASKDLGGSIKFTKTGELAEGEKLLRIVSAFRSPEYQQQLRQQSPGSGRAALAKNSAHSTGQALDLYVGGEPVSTKDANRLLQVRTPAYKWLVKNAARFGFHNYFYEPWHWEYVGAAGK